MSLNKTNLDDILYLSSQHYQLMQQSNLFSPQEMISHEHLSLHWQSGFLSTDEANNLLLSLIQTIDWQQPLLKVYGKWHPTPRLVNFMADHDVSGYQYSHSQHEITPWTPSLLALKQRIEHQSGAHYNSVLINYYRDGRDTMGWHADDETELGMQPTIASLSVGATRDLHFRRKDDHRKLIRLSLDNGSLLIMSQKTQACWQHHIPKRLCCTEPRINLTFRAISNQRP